MWGIKPKTRKPESTPGSGGKSASKTKHFKLSSGKVSKTKKQNSCKKSKTVPNFKEKLEYFQNLSKNKNDMEVATKLNFNLGGVGQPSTSSTSKLKRKLNILLDEQTDCNYISKSRFNSQVNTHNSSFSQPAGTGVNSGT